MFSRMKSATFKGMMIWYQTLVRFSPCGSHEAHLIEYQQMGGIGFPKGYQKLSKKCSSPLHIWLFFTSVKNVVLNDIAKQDFCEYVILFYNILSHSSWQIKGKHFLHILIQTRSTLGGSDRTVCCDDELRVWLCRNLCVLTIMKLPP